MQIEAVKRIIAEQRKELEEVLAQKHLVTREYLRHVVPFLRSPNVLAILGVRRAGKSVFTMLIAQHLKVPFAYINFDDERLLGAKTEDLDTVLQAFYELYGDITLVILDEAHNVSGWELFVNRLRRTKKVIVTGSNSQLLSGELATHLTGRHIDFILYPLSFRELSPFKSTPYIAEDIAKVRKRLNSYMHESGFPEFITLGPRIVESIYQDIITKDCLQRYDIKNKKTFKELANYLISNFSSEFTYSKLSRIFSIKDVHTVKNYIEYLKESFLIVVLDRFSPKLKQQVIAPKKVYVVDHGICNFLSFKVSRDLGRILENIVFIELLRRTSANKKREVFYWKDYQQNEIDFVIKEGVAIKELLQVCYDVSDVETKQRELKALLRASKELQCKNLIVITWDYEAQENIDGKKITFLPAWKWLLKS